MKKGKKLYEGKAKIIYSTSDKNLVIQYFKDDATAFNNEKRTTIEGKGVLNNRISEHILTNLSQIGIENHLVKRLNMREQLIRFVEIIPIEFVIRNIATGSLTKRFLKKMDPSSPDKLSSIILSGWGIIPKTFFSLLKIPAIFFIEPLGFIWSFVLPFWSQ